MEGQLNNIIDNVSISNLIFLMQLPNCCCSGEHESHVWVSGWPVDSDE